MSWMSLHANGFEGVEAEYSPTHGTDYGAQIPAYVLVKIGDHHASLGLKIEDARVLSASLARILMLHDSVEDLAAELSADDVSEPSPKVA
ncbi:hypothetical protein [Nocardia sp. alder85J]|uniref:hypothetical protein n=1 Tax=Nocardia sp. alder85J TaxID=2862949 RepID=UPI001CD50862|nr:hypothetical protein [Nocardia sp. alder85J]MCX4095067.1 hypothetical protein [Nocardia sp. alder85J]